LDPTKYGKGVMKSCLSRPNQEDVLTTESHPHPSAQYTGIIQEAVNFKGRDYEQGDLVMMWDAKMGQPDDSEKSEKSWQGPFMIKRKSPDDCYYLSTLQGRPLPLPVIENLLKPHHGEDN
jgi:hypothetical protein